MKRLKTILQDYAMMNNISYTSDDDLINKTMGYLFDFEMPSYMWVDPNDPTRFGDETDYLKKSFLQNYLYDYIAFNDVNRFKSRLQNALRIKLPYYNDMLWTEQWPRLFITNPAANTDYKEIYKKIIDITRDQTGNNQTVSNTDELTSSISDSTSNDKTDTTSNDTTTNHANTTSKTSTKDTSNTAGNTFSLSVDNDFPKSEMILDQEVLGNYATTANKSNGDSSSNATSTSSADTTSDTMEDNTTNTKSNTTANTTANTKMNDTRQSLNNMLVNYLENNKDLSKEDFEFQRIGNIGIQTPGEVFEKTRKAYINVIEHLLNDKMIVKLFSLIINEDEEDDIYEYGFY